MPLISNSGTLTTFPSAGYTGLIRLWRPGEPGEVLLEYTNGALVGAYQAKPFTTLPLPLSIPDGQYNAQYMSGTAANACIKDRCATHSANLSGSLGANLGLQHIQAFTPGTAAQIASLQQQVTIAQGNAASLGTQNNQLNSANAQLTTDLATAIAARNASQSALSTITTQLSTAQAQISSLQAQLAAKVRELATLQTQLNECLNPAVPVVVGLTNAEKAVVEAMSSVEVPEVSCVPAVAPAAKKSSREEDLVRKAMDEAMAGSPCD